MSEYFYDSGLQANVAIADLDSISPNLIGFSRVIVEVLCVALNGTYMHFESRLGVSSSDSQVHRSRDLIGGDRETVILDAVNNGIRITFRLFGGAQTGTITYRVIGYG